LIGDDDLGRGGRRRSPNVESESITSKSRLNFRRSSYFHCRWSIAGQTTRMRRMRRRRRSSSRTSPAWIVLPIDSSQFN
jgi:hypothetical protein